jgi:hypothetical protein
MPAHLITNAFGDWVERIRHDYGVGDPELYSGVPADTFHRSLNPFLKTEADLRVKFGGFLEEYLLSRAEGRTFTVHAEMLVYPDSRSFADLTVHEVRASKLWKDEKGPDSVMGSLKGVIEVKYANFQDPDWYFDDLKKNSVFKDLERLATLGPGIARVMLIFDEGSKVSGKNVERVKNLSRANDILILSNNPGF